MKKLIIIVLAFIIFNPAVNAEKESEIGLVNDQLDNVTIQLKRFHQFQFAGYYAAIEKGFYAEEGLEVELRERVIGSSHIKDVLQGRAQYGVADPGLLLARLQGEPVVLLAQILQHSPLVLLTREDSGIREPNDLAHKRVMFDSKGHDDMPFIALLLDTFGKFDAVEVQKVSFNYHDLIDGKTDVIPGYITDHPNWFRQHNVSVNIINPRDYGIDLYGDNLFTTEQELSAYPARVEKIRRATLKGWRYALKNRLEIIDLILKKYNPQGFSQDYLEYEAREMGKLIAPELVELGSVNTARYQDIANTYGRAGYIDQTTLDADFFYQNKASAKQIQLSAGEQAWLAEHPEITLGFTSEVEPQLIAEEDGQLSGALIDIYDELESLIGIKVNIELDEWSSTIRKAKNGKIDGLLASAITLAESIGLIHTDSLTTANPTIFYKKDSPLEINSVKDLIGKKVSVLKGVYIVEQALKPYKDDIEIIETEKALDMIEQVLEGKVDAAFGLNYHNYQIGKHHLSGIVPVYFSHKYSAKSVASVRSEWPEFVSIMNKALTILGRARLNEINSKWIQREERLFLTDDESLWLEAHPEIVLGTDREWSPYVVQRVDGSLTGIEVDLINLINELTGANIRLELGKWPDIVEKAKKGDIDGLTSLAYNSQDVTSFLFCDSFYSVSEYIYTYKPFALNLTEMEDLVGKKVALLRSNRAGEKLLQQHPGIILVPAYSNEGMISMLTSGQVDAVIGGICFRFAALEKMISDIGISFIVPNSEAEILYSIRKDWPELHSIMNKSLAAISLGERMAIMERWGGKLMELPIAAQLGLSVEEKRWLDTHPVISMCVDPNWMPFEQINESGEYEGMVADYMTLFASRLGVTFELYPTESYEESLSKLTSGECTILSSGFTDEAVRKGLVTKEYLQLSHVFVVHHGLPFIHDIHGFDGLRIGMVASYPIQDKLRKLLPQSELVLVDNVDAGVRKVASGELDTFSESLTTISYSIQKQSLNNVKIGGVIPGEEPVTMVVTEDELDLIPILNKAIDSITQEDRKRIADQWISVRFERGFDYAILWRILFVITIVLALFFCWNRRLSKEVATRQRTEIALQTAKDAAESANQAKSIFLANMSHEIRTPMNTLLGFTEILKRTESDQMKIDYIEHIHSSGKALLCLINDILDLSKVEAGKLELQYAAVSIDQLLAEIRGIFEYKISDKGLEFIIIKLNDIPPLLILDEVRVRQVLINLLSNAVKFTDSGFIKLSVSALKAGGTTNSRVNLSIVVGDSGIGIPEDQYKKIFDPFEQTKGQKSKEYGGAGLGLAITKRLVEMMNGGIHVESIDGKGATFHIDLNDVEIASGKEVAETENILDEESVYFDPASILIVDDIDYNRELLSNYLKPWEISIIEAESGVEALAHARSYKPDLILLDMKMPVMDGYEMSEQMCKDENLKDIPVIAVTASALKQDEEVISKLCNGYLRKPVSRTSLILELMNHLPHTVRKQ